MESCVGLLISREKESNTFSDLQVVLFWWILMPRYTALAFSIFGLVLIVHIVSTYSALGRIIMSTGAMSSHRILEKEIEEEMLPPRLAEELLRRTKEARAAAVPVNLQYRSINSRASVVENRGHMGSNNRDNIGRVINEVLRTGCIYRYAHRLKNQHSRQFDRRGWRVARATMEYGVLPSQVFYHCIRSRIC